MFFFQIWNEYIKKKEAFLFACTEITPQATSTLFFLSFRVMGCLWLVSRPIDAMQVS